MSEYLKKCNEVRLVGMLEKEFEFYYSLSNRVVKQDYYINYIIIKRENKVDEHIPVVMQKDKIDFRKEYKCSEVEIIGKLKENNYTRKSFLYVFIKSMSFLSVGHKMEEIAKVKIECVLHKKVTTRVQKDGRLRLDFKIRYNQMIITCVAWNRNARIINKKVEEGTELILSGRIETRLYHKNEEWKETNEFVVKDIGYVM
ncbi:MAG: single-stranded DNA-binding protein [Clostridia bacterium]|nr:single-stranded DNA-binding protein [Clostridia bacterium]